MTAPPMVPGGAPELCPGCRRPVAGFFVVGHDQAACLSAHTQKMHIWVFGKAGSLRWGVDPPVRLEHHDAAESAAARRVEASGVER